MHTVGDCYRKRIKPGSLHIAQCYGTPMGHNDAQSSVSETVLENTTGRIGWLDSILTGVPTALCIHSLVGTSVGQQDVYTVAICTLRPHILVW